MERLNRFFYKTYTWGYPAGIRRRNRFAKPGYAASAAIIAAAIFGMNTLQTTVYQLFTLLAALFIFALFSSFRFRARFRAERKLPTIATAGEKFSYTVRIENLTDKKQLGLIFQEIPNLRFPTYDEFLLAREPGELKRNRWDRAVKFHRFQWLMKQHIRISPKEQELPEIGANSYVHLYSELTPHRRGILELNGVYIKRPEPLGLFKAFIQIPLHDRILVLPKRYPIPSIDLPGTRKHHTGGVALASAVGNTNEFHSLREYQPGDPMRRLHWKSVAKTGELIIRENEDEYFVRHALILDTFATEPTTNRFETAVSIAASLACTIRTQDSLLDLMFVEDKAYCFTAGRGIDHTAKMLELLACVEPCTDKKFPDIFPLVAEHAALLSGCICIFQTWDDDRRKLAELLSARGIPAKILVVTEGETIEPSDRFSLHIIDAASPEEGLAKL